MSHLWFWVAATAGAPTAPAVLAVVSDHLEAGRHRGYWCDEGDLPCGCTFGSVFRQHEPIWVGSFRQAIHAEEASGLGARVASCVLSAPPGSKRVHLILSSNGERATAELVDTDLRDPREVDCIAGALKAWSTRDAAADAGRYYYWTTIRDFNH